ncbi:amino acid acetyltransferase [Pelistega indica]|uniref:Amino-acid acetyltransferase n=1 Tax=Pelistega indica TaxID=1414851 RepID=V8GB20_9BURK|nr:MULTISPECIES: amino-acid N-acetyltransferase [Pelistega]ETD72937.1 amino acid acetyltransferase [Pelistega indica]
MTNTIETFSALDAPEYAPAQFVRWFREVAPYVHTMRGKTFVVGFGGDLVQEGKLNALVQDLSLLTALGVKLVLVFGSRPQVNEQLRLKGFDFQFGLTVEPTSAVALECCKEAAGEIRLDIEAAFSQGLPNTPMSNSHIHVISGNFVTAQPAGIIDGVDYKHTGKVRKFDIESIQKALSLGSVVLFGPIGFSPTGEAFNIAMEELATNIAISLKAEKLIFMNKSNLLRNENGEVITEIARADVDKLLQTSEQLELDIEFANYLKQSSRAVRRGVKRAHIIPHDLDGSILLEYFTHDGVGTMVVEDTLDDLRPATIDDVGAIVSLIEPLEADGTLVPRGRHIIERDVEKFTILEHDGIIYGCVSLMPYPNEKMGEMACLIVHPDWQSSGEGELLLRHTETKARALGLKHLFVLTTRTSHWFIKRGFTQGKVEDLPAEKQMNYNRARNSLIFIKKL